MMALPRLIMSFVACIALAQCAAPAPASDRVIGLDQVAGAWDIVSFGVYRPQRLDSDGQRHAFVDFGDGSISFTIECNYSGVPARIDASGRLNVDARERFQTTMLCQGERDRRENDFFAFFESRPIISRAGEALVLASGDTQLVLQRPQARRAPLLPTSLAELSGRWTASILYHDVEHGNRNLISWLDGAPATFELAPERFVLSFDCEHIEARATLQAPGMVQLSEPQRRTGASCRIPQAERDLGVSILSGAGQLERIGGERLHFVNGDVRAVLERQP